MGGSGWIWGDGEMGGGWGMGGEMDEWNKEKKKEKKKKRMHVCTVQV